MFVPRTVFKIPFLLKFTEHPFGAVIPFTESLISDVSKSFRPLVFAGQQLGLALVFYNYPSFVREITVKLAEHLTQFFTYFIKFV